LENGERDRPGRCVRRLAECSFALFSRQSLIEQPTQPIEMRKPESVEKLLRQSRNVLALSLLQVEKVRMRTSFKNNLHFKSKPGFESACLICGHCFY
jgi:hypothetical protein